MKFGFFYDGPITRNSEMQCFGTSINDEMFSKYFQVADKLDVCIRVKESDNTIGLKEIKDKRIDFIKCVNLSSFSGMLKQGQAKKIIKDVLKDCDGAFIRLPSRIGLVAVECCEEMNKTYMIEVVACAWDVMWHHSVKGKIMALPNFLQTRRAIKNAPAVLYVTKEFLQKRYPTKGESIGCSDVSLAEIDDSVIEKSLTKIKEKNNKANKIIIGTTGAVHVKYKGQQRVIRALGVLKKQGYTNFEYQIVGGGSQEYLRREAKNNNVENQVKFIGPLPQEQVIEWLDKIDLYIQPSKTEGLPRSLVEAMSRGIPVYGTDTGGIPELLDNECMFSNDRQCVREIQEILLSLTPEKMYNQAKRNLDIVKEYAYDKLEIRRQKFYNKIFGTR